MIAPFLAVATALISISVIPFGPEIEIVGVEDMDAVHGFEDWPIVRVCPIFAVGVYGVALGRLGIQ